MFIDTTKLQNVVDLRSAIILIRKIQSFYINGRLLLWEEELKSKDPIKIKKAKDDIENYWRTCMLDIFVGLNDNGYKVDLEGSKININIK